VNSQADNNDVRSHLAYIIKSSHCREAKPTLALLYY